MGITADDDAAQNTLNSWMKRNVAKEHELYVKLCTKNKTKALPEYFPIAPPTPNKVFDTPRFSPEEDTARRLEDLYKVTQMFDRLKTIPRNLRLWRGNEHGFYVKECEELGHHPLPLKTTLVPPPRQRILIDDEEVQFVGQTCLSLVVSLLPTEMFPELNQRLRHIINRSLDHPLGPIDVAARSLQSVLDSPDDRLRKAEYEKLRIIKRAKWKPIFTRFYLKANPEKTEEDIEALLDKSEGQEEEVFGQMKDKYGIYSDSEESESEHEKWWWEKGVQGRIGVRMKSKEVKNEVRMKSKVQGCKEWSQNEYVGGGEWKGGED